MTAVEVCPICDIAGCRHVRESKAKMTHPTDEELDALVRRAKERAKEDRQIQANNEAVAVALKGQRLLFDQGFRSQSNTFAVRLGLDYENCAKKDARLASDWEEAAYAITTLRTQLAEVKAEKERLGRELNLARYGQPDFSWQVHKEAIAEANARADRAEADLQAMTMLKENYAAMKDRAEAERAAQIEVDARIAEAERKLWDRGYCTTSAGFEVCRSLTNVRETIRAQPHDRSALDRMQAEAREKALQDAADEMEDERAKQAILALIEKP